MNREIYPGKPIRILVTGANGQLGGEFRSWTDNPAYHFIFSDLPDLDLSDKSAVYEFLALHKPDFVINCAAYTAVDKAETDRETAFKINVTAVEYVASACRDLNITLIQISTDFVFPGNTSNPLSEDDPTGPVNYYGETKLQGERISMNICSGTVIVRTSWLYSVSGRNFVNTMLRIAGERKLIDVVSDQFGSPTYSGDLAAALIGIVTMIHTHPSGPGGFAGIYHYSNEGVISWFDFAKAVFDIRKIPVRLNPVLTAQYPTPARRPLYSVLDKSKIKQRFILEIPYWRDSLVKCLSSGNT